MARCPVVARAWSCCYCTWKGAWCSWLPHGCLHLADAAPRLRLTRCPCLTLRPASALTPCRCLNLHPQGVQRCSLRRRPRRRPRCRRPRRRPAAGLPQLPAGGDILEAASGGSLGLLQSLGLLHMQVGRQDTCLACTAGQRWRAWPHAGTSKRKRAPDPSAHFISRINPLAAAGRLLRLLPGAPGRVSGDTIVSRCFVCRPADRQLLAPCSAAGWVVSCTVAALAAAQLPGCTAVDLATHVGKSRLPGLPHGLPACLLTPLASSRCRANISLMPALPRLGAGLSAAAGAAAAAASACRSGRWTTPQVRLAALRCA